MSYVKQLLQNNVGNKTVLTMSDLVLTGDDYNNAKLRSALKYAVKTKDLYRIVRGVYALSNNYSRLEFGNKWRIPSYVSLYTVLSQNGVVFQPYTSIFLMASRSEVKSIDGQKYIYRKIKSEILLNQIGIVQKGNVAIATTERALCDKLYLEGEEYFDNLRTVDWDLMQKLNSEVYQNNIVIEEFIRKNKV